MNDAALIGIDLGKRSFTCRPSKAAVATSLRQSAWCRANPPGISKRGEKNLRRLRMQCAREYLQRLCHRREAHPL